MDIARRILADIDHALAGQPVPRVKAVHLPPQAAAGTKDGEFGAVELDDGTLGLSCVLLDGGDRVTLEPRDLRTCTQVLTTSTVLLNHTLDHVLAHCGAAPRIAMVGPGAGCLPDALFACGITKLGGTTLGGTWIEDGPAFVAALTAGRPWGAAARKCCIVRSDCAAWADRLSPTL